MLVKQQHIQSPLPQAPAGCRKFSAARTTAHLMALAAGLQSVAGLQPGTGQPAVDRKWKTVQSRDSRQATAITGLAQLWLELSDHADHENETCIY